MVPEIWPYVGHGGNFKIFEFIFLEFRPLQWDFGQSGVKGSRNLPLGPEEEVDVDKSVATVSNVFSGFASS